MKTNSSLQVGVKAFIFNKKGLVLVLKRNSQEYQSIGGQWDIPGGRIDPKYNLIQNLKREVSEETGLKIINAKLLAAQDIKASAMVVRLTYTSHALGASKVVLSKEHTDYKWVNPKELLKLKDFDPYAREVIKDNLKDIIKDTN